MGEGAFSILIADRNRRVREFLGRELAAEGYSIRMAKDGREVLAAIKEDDPPDLIILDLDAACIGCPALCARLGLPDSHPPFIIHSFLEEQVQHACAECAVAVVEKSENPEALKSTVGEVLSRFYPLRFSAARKQDATDADFGSDSRHE